LLRNQVGISNDFSLLLPFISGDNNFTDCGAHLPLSAEIITLSAARSSLDAMTMTASVQQDVIIYDVYENGILFLHRTPFFRIKRLINRKTM
jgi:hypothetical protein